MKKTFMKRDVFTYRFLETGGTAYHPGVPGKGPGLVRKHRRGGVHGLESLPGFSWQGRERRIGEAGEGC